MSLAQRLAQRGAAPGESSRSSAPPSTRVRSSGGEGFRREEIVVPVSARMPRPAVLGDDLRSIELPRAPVLAEALGSLARLPKAGACPERPAVLLDLETTGLLGQTGAVICVVGAAWHVAPDQLCLVQWTLHRVGGEAAMLADLHEALVARVGPRSPFVTFNGASFDLPLLRRRLVRHGVVRPTDDPLRAPHVDLLPPARRLWRDRGPDCRLGTLEARQLSLHREGDVGGAEVVELLWQWLEDPEGAREDLARVQRHNRVDVLSLSALAWTMHRRLQAPVDAVERLRAARYHQRLERPDPALALLQPLLDALARSQGSGWGPGRGSELMVAAGLLAAELERRRGRHDAAARRWAQVCRRVPGHPEAHEALAKHLEHRARRPAQALAVAAASDTPCDARLARLRRRTGSAAIPPVDEVLGAWAEPAV
ncbi:MAG: ribonuclease H-like domain-containing protein [Myxococcales bacterium]|nr:ribonuclease H-like domain-containing protein [Myxococcales bacterium]